MGQPTNEMEKISGKNIYVLLDFNAQIGKEGKFRNILGKSPAHKVANKNGERITKLGKNFNLKLMTTHSLLGNTKQIEIIEPQTTIWVNYRTII